MCNGRGGGLENGNRKLAKGVKIMAIIDRSGLPLLVRAHATNHHEVKLVSPHKKNRKKLKTQDGRKLLRYQRRKVVERFFAWIKNKRRLLDRWQRYPGIFGFAQVSAAI